MLNRMTALLMITAAITFFACEKSDPPLADNALQFEAGEQGLATDVNAKDITIKLSRNAETAIPITIELKESGLVYGTHYSTEPASTAGVLSLTIPAGNNSVSFRVTKKTEILLDGDEYIEFNIKNAGTPIGQTSKLKLSFSSIVSAGSSLELNGGEGGSAAVNSVYVDFSNNAQTAVLRKSYDLMFYSGADFRVLLNSSAVYVAKMVNKTDINAVSAADITPDDLAVGFGFGSTALIDNVEGDITKNVLGAVSATDAENKVYVISRAGATNAAPAPADLKKVRILRNGNGYTLQYADINETTFKTLTVEKNAAYNFRFASFTNGVVEVEPAKDRWDIMWSYGTYTTPYMGKIIPYGFSDLVFTNHTGGAQVAEVLNTETITYATFNESNIAAVSFSTKRDAIGAKWRVTQGTIGVAKDRFYVVKDAAGNVYKLKFINFHSTAVDGGKRGYPNIEFKLVKKA